MDDEAKFQLYWGLAMLSFGLLLTLLAKHP
jgi:hypothetical protein